MGRDRVIQLAMCLVVIVGLSVGGGLLGNLIETSERRALRYTDNADENMPPFVAIGTAIGAFRGLIVDYLWIKANLMVERGQYYQVMEDTDLITKLQPRFAPVWVFHGHNMAYNISVATNTPQERWEWVQAGIDLVRNKGLRYNPNDMELHKELSFWLGHKVGGVSDDAHLYYKREWARDWHNLLGEPPMEQGARIAWMQEVADAPDTLEAAIERTPEVAELVQRMHDGVDAIDESFNFDTDKRFLELHALWDAVNQQSYIAEQLSFRDELDQQGSRMFRLFNELHEDPRFDEAWKTLLSYVRKQTLEDEYNMDPQLMAQYTEEIGPIDWRSPHAHSYYWARRGSDLAGFRSLSEYDETLRINNDRQQAHALQALARTGRVYFDPFSPGYPGQAPEPRFIDTIDDHFERFYVKHFDAKGAGGETFIAFIKNFLSDAIREMYRYGEIERAQKLLDILDARFGRGGYPPNTQYAVDLDVFVAKETQGEYERQPHMAPSDVIGSLRYGYRIGVGENRPEVYKEAVEFAKWVTEFFRGSDNVNFTTKMGIGRLRDILQTLDKSAEIAFLQLMLDPIVPFEERITIWSQIDDMEPQLRVRVYDQIIQPLGRQYASSPLSQAMPLEEAFPEPPGLELFRQQIALEREAERAAQESLDVGAKVKSLGN
ncbi:MAG: hypothetical protein VX527_01445 [Planctomycetota bacterium]|nr:hypothetical protein [Planctomycetota bacterium]